MAEAVKGYVLSQLFCILLSVQFMQRSNECQIKSKNVIAKLDRVVYNEYIEISKCI